MQYVAITQIMSTVHSVKFILPLFTTFHTSLVPVPDMTYNVFGGTLNLSLSHTSLAQL